MDKRREARSIDKLGHPPGTNPGGCFYVHQFKGTRTALSALFELVCCDTEAARQLAGMDLDREIVYCDPQTGLFYNHEDGSWRYISGSLILL